MCPFATRIAADTMFFRPRSKSKGRLAQKIAHVEIAPKKYRKKRLLEAGLYEILVMITIPAAMTQVGGALDGITNRL